jgi:hypothetical protein
MSAILSQDRKYRYRLTRDIGMMGDGACCFVMLNPSTADEDNDDPTIRRCIGFAKRWNCARLEVVNLFAYRSTSPDVLSAMSRNIAVGPENDYYIVESCKSSRLVVCAWGNSGVLFGRDQEIIRLLRFNGLVPKALKINAKSHQPAHPLYLKETAQLLEIKP